MLCFLFGVYGVLGFMNLPLARDEKLALLSLGALLNVRKVRRRIGGHCLLLGGLVMERGFCIGGNLVFCS